MKSTITYSLLAAAAACGVALGQTTAYTTPVGYTTKSLPANQFTLVGLTVHNPTVAAGILDAESAAPNTLTDNEVNFTTTLTSGAKYILELNDGTVQVVTSWSGSVLTTSDNITGLVTPGTTAYKLRKAATISEVFGANNSVGLTPDTDGSRAGTDYILVVNDAGTAFNTVYYFDDGETTGWFTTGDDAADNLVIAYPDSFFVQRAAGSPLSLVVSGEVKTVGTGGVLISGFNYANGVVPAGSTLGNSGLEAYLTPDIDGSRNGTDYVLVQQGSAYITCYYYDDGETTGWFTTGDDAAESVALDGGFLVQSASGPKAYKINVPSTYNGL